MKHNTEIVKVLAPFETKEEETLIRASEIIKSGGLVIFPTETVYGIGADATNPKAAKKIFEAKGRPSDNPLIIHISEPKEAEDYAYTSQTYYKLAEHFMPGPLTVILPSRETVPPETRGGLSTVAVRCPENTVAHRLIELCGVPIAAPSANLSGSPSPTTAKHCIDDMFGRVDMIIDGGSCDFGLESTIVKVDREGEVTLLRPGQITVEDIADADITVKIADAVTDRLREGEIALSPGMKYRHYAPSAPLYLFDGDRASLLRYINEHNFGKIALILYSEDIEYFSLALPEAVVFDFGNRGDKVSQAHSLFDLLRLVDVEDFDNIFAPLPDKNGIGLALYNRLIRAAAHQIIKFDGE